MDDISFVSGYVIYLAKLVIKSIVVIPIIVIACVWKTMNSGEKLSSEQAQQKGEEMGREYAAKWLA